MKALITGATGFVGSHVVDELLERGADVRALLRDPSKARHLDRPDVEVIVGDARDPDVLTSAVRGMDVIFHCAAAVGSHFSRNEIYDTNLNGVRHLLEAMRRVGAQQRCRLMLLSSVNVLGTRSLDGATEDEPCRRSHDPAADVKIEMERLALDYHRQHGLDLTIIRPCFIYGPRDRHNLPQIVRALRAGKFAYLGSKDNIVPIVHVNDVVQALLLAAESPRAAGRVYNITDGSRTTIRELVEHLAALLRCPPPERVLPYIVPHAACVLFGVWSWLLRRPIAGPVTRAGLRFLGTSRFVSIRRAQEELGYVPRVLYREGVASTLQWIEEQASGQVTSLSAQT